MPASVDEKSKLIDESNDTYCDIDPILSSVLKKCKFALLPTITNIINFSLAFGIFPDQFKSCSVHPLLTKLNCDKDDLSNYRPISHLSFLSKLTERVAKNRLTNFISDNNLLNSFQSAYTKYHSTETTFLAVHDHVIRAIGQQQITCLCLLDLSAAFDTIDHSILIDRLSSWFGISGTVLNWSPHNQTLGSTFCVLDSTFWLDSTLRIRPGWHCTFSDKLAQENSIKIAFFLRTGRDDRV
jgi:Reverse transcriptase (RNA-dependent DNA polymerase)